MMSDSFYKMNQNPEARRNFMRNLLQDVKAVEWMLSAGLFEDDTIRIGAEQELVLLNPGWLPAPIYDKILTDANDPQLTTELGKFNVEINLSPQTFEGDALRKMQHELESKVALIRKIAQKHDSNVLLTGILPSLGWNHLQFEWMTPNPRYRYLSEVMLGHKQGNFDLNIKGLDELHASHPNILFEACNTSFQVHLQVKPQEFVSRYNWAQAIAAPVLAASVNSPLLMGKRLWRETRIALFQQSIDMRNAHLKRDAEPRVSFGHQWLKHSAAHYYQDVVSRFNSLIISDNNEDSLAKLRQGRIPFLNALCIHNGTVYTWNRTCYGVSSTGKPHLRIECRYMPAGPTTTDEMANAAFWLGLMMGMPEELSNIHELMRFEDARLNFYHAAQMGLDAHINWLGKNRKVCELISTRFLPWAQNGLKKISINNEDINLYLGIIANRVKNKQTGAAWLLKNYGQLLHDSTPYEASIQITSEMYNRHIENKPVHEWTDVDTYAKPQTKKFEYVKHIMTTDLATVQAEDLLEMALNIMVWRNVRYVMVENERHEPVGLVASRILVKLLREGWKENLVVKDVMISNLITVTPETTTAEAINKMNVNNIGCLPVVESGKLIGLITEREIVKVAAVAKKFEQ